MLVASSGAPFQRSLSERRRPAARGLLFARWKAAQHESQATYRFNRRSITIYPCISLRPSQTCQTHFFYCDTFRLVRLI